MSTESSQARTKGIRTGSGVSLGGGAGRVSWTARRGAASFEAGAAVGARGELDVDDGADGGGGVEDGAADEVADEEGVGVEGGELVGGDEELLAGEGFGGGDAVAAGELEDDPAGVFAGGEKVLFDADGRGVGRRDGSVGGGEGELTARGEDVGEVAEGVSEKLAAAALRTQQASEWNPAGVRDAIVQCRLPHRLKSRGD